MFGKKKVHSLFNLVDDSRIIVNDFKLRSTDTGFESYRTLNYSLYHKLEEAEMLPKLEEHLEKLFEGDVDSGNGDMLDAILFAATREALPDLKRQYYEHSDMLRRLVIRHISDREDIRRIKEEREKELAIIEADYEKTCRLLVQAYGEV